MRNWNMRQRLQFKWVMIALVIEVALFPGTGAVDARAAESVQDAHDTYCVACHDSNIYTRDGRLANDYDALRAQVVRWQSTIALNWSDEEVDRMAVWLAKRFYRIPCPDQC